ncbi:Putative transposase of IS4/5 family [Rhodoferax sp. OV413]|uniref:transposase n=1 Tax=Rhodoferax sp. OV413 TaxID=1855285 RepID=UPI00088C211C|nr:transposase [Rhodoferax sp. OV413]SDP92872.1 Putative transposase of IS4/5 family [Rhodoferax sp. OV413]
MEWAFGIAVKNGQLVVEGTSRDGDLEIGNLLELGTCGVPKCSQLVKHKGTLDFSALVAVNADEYLDALGLHAPQKLPNRHQVFECRFDGVRVVFPALVLMRALFRPNKFLLPVMFRPQALDRIRFLDYTRTPTEVVVDASWRGTYRSGEEVNQCISWMTLFPSAIRLASSVHEFAMRGEIGMSLPLGSARATMHGLNVGGILFVTEMKVMAVHANEDPIPGATGCSQDFVLRNVSYDGKLKSSLAEISKFPIGKNGELGVSDLEWTAIAPTLLKGQERAREILNQRHLFDAILQKINFCTSWRTLAPKSGTGNNARFAERNWRSRETLMPSLEILMTMRT